MISDLLTLITMSLYYKQHNRNDSHNDRFNYTIIKLDRFPFDRHFDLVSRKLPQPCKESRPD